MVEVRIWYGRFINGIRFVTDRGQSAMFGSSDPTNASPDVSTKTYAVPAGAVFAGLFGQYSVFRPGTDAEALNAVGCVFVDE